MMVRGDFLYVCPLCIELDLMMTSVSRLLQNKNIYKLGHFKRKARDIDLCVILLASQLRLLASNFLTLKSFIFHNQHLCIPGLFVKN